jgi:alanine-glyoxylate transaminase/serine-glyoxylate transaminase/serine-pyruvate transaminase
MIPGPVEVRPEILEVMGRPMVPHYESEWAQIHADTIEMAKAVFQTTGDLFIMVGSGSAGLEACLSQLTGNGGRTLIPTNGVFGKLLVKIARTYSDQIEEVEFPGEEPIAPEALDRLLIEREDVRSVAVVHCETHTGLLNPVHEYGDICRAHGAFLMVDAISSLGGARLEMDNWNIDLCVTASQKALGAPPGLCLVAVNPRCWLLFEKRASGQGWYLNLNAWRQRATEWADWHPSLTTMAVNNFLALRKALELILSEGLDNRFARHRQASLLIRQGARNLGLKPYIPDEYASSTLTTVILPEGVSVQALRDHVKNEHRIMVAGANIPCGERAFRIGHMGPEATLENAVSVLVAVEDYLRKVGLEVKTGQCLSGLDPQLLDW